MREYLKRLAELVAAGFVAGVSAHLVEHGLDLSGAGVKGLLVAGALAAYGVVVKSVGDRKRPTVS